MSEQPDLRALGNKVDAPSTPDMKTLEVIPWHIELGTPVLRFTTSEFTSLCPVTAQPDFATIIIDYCPFKSIIESKSLKLYLHSFRQHKGFHEAITARIGIELCAVSSPVWLRIASFWYPRAGIKIDAVWQTGKLSEDFHALALPGPSMSH